MVVLSNPFCPISFGFLGFLGAILSRKSALYSDGNPTHKGRRNEEEDELLAASDNECHEISEDRIATFLENQKQEYYKSIGMVPPKQLNNFESSTTPGASMIEFSSSRETSYIDEGDETALTSLSSTPFPVYPAQTYRMNDSELDPLSPREVPDRASSVENDCPATFQDEPEPEVPLPEVSEGESPGESALGVDELEQS